MESMVVSHDADGIAQMCRYSDRVQPQLSGSGGEEWMQQLTIKSGPPHGHLSSKYAHESILAHYEQNLVHLPVRC